MRRSLFLILFLILGYISKSQEDTIYFSKTGDTVLYSPTWAGNIYSDTVRHYLNIASFAEGDTLKIISSFTITTKRKDNFNDFIPTDSLKKYNLEFDGYLQDSSDNDVILTITPKNIIKIDTYYQANQFIYTADIEIILKCKSKIIRQETVKHYYIAKREEDIDINDICRFKSWKKRGADKYLISYKIKESLYSGKPYGFSIVTNWYYGYY